MFRDQVVSLCDGADAWNGRARVTLESLDRQIRGSTTDKRLLAPWDHFARGLRAHFAQEEQVLFPALRALAGGEPPEGERFVRMLEEMAQEIGEVCTIADALRNAARDAGDLEPDILAFLDELEEQARREGEQLLPAARQLLASWPEETAPTQVPHHAPSPGPDGGVLRRTARRLRGLLKG